MFNASKVGGLCAALSAVIVATAYMFYAAQLDAGGFQYNPQETLELMVQNQSQYFIWNTATYLVNAVLLIIAGSVLWTQLRGDAPALATISGVLIAVWGTILIGAGTIANLSLSVLSKTFVASPEQAHTLLLTFATIEDALGGAGSEFVGALWVLFVSAAALQTTYFPRAMGYFGIIIGVVGALNILPIFAELTAGVSSFANIIWLFMVGIIMMSKQAST